MSSDKLTKTVPAIAQSIDAILDTPAAKAGPVRPLAKLRPSWIGPAPQEHPKTAGAPAMKQHTTIEYSSRGLQPPVYILTSLSDPQWEAVQMQAEKTNDGQYKFSKAFDVEEGEYQYKFRLGPGDWWACDETKPTVDDGSGNKNNLLVVKPQVSDPVHVETAGKDSKTANTVNTPTSSTPVAPSPYLYRQARLSGVPIEHPPTISPLLTKHDDFVPDKGSESEQTPEHEEKSPMSTASSDDHHSPILLPHESPRSSPVEHVHYHQATPPKNTRQAYTSPTIPAEADPNDPSLIKFPTDHAGIMDLLRRVSISHSPDTGLHHPDAGSPHSLALSGSSKSTHTLPSLHEAEEGELEKIREIEENEVEKEEESGEEMDPLRAAAVPMTPPLTPNEPEDADFEPKIEVTEKIVVEERIVVEVVDERGGWFETLLTNVGGKGNAIAIAVGLLVVAASISAMQFL